MNTSEGNIKRSLVLAGGGVRLAYQAGVLQALEEYSLRFDHIDGTSGGIFNTGMIASGLCAEEIADRWRKLKLFYFFSLSPLRSYLRIGRMTGLGSSDGIRRKVFPALNIDLEKIRGNRDVTATFNVCNFSDKSIESIPNELVTEDHLIAGVSLPVFMPGVQIQESWYSDAVWIKDANLMEAARRGVDEIWLVWAIGNNHDYLPGSFNQYVHMIEMSANGGLFQEYEQLKCLNDRIARGDSPYGQKEPIRLHVIKPEFPLPLDPDLFLYKIDTSALINMGYSDARNYLADPPREGVPPDMRSTKMKAPGVTLTFRHRFSGHAEFRGQKSFISLAAYFIVRKFAEEVPISAYTSIFIGALGKEISTHDSKAVLRHSGKQRSIYVESVLYLDGQKYILSVTIPIGSVLEWRLGLEFKKAKLELQLIQNDTRRMVLKGILTQGIMSRLGGIFNTGLRNFYGPGTNFREKGRMMSLLFRR